MKEAERSYYVVDEVMELLGIERNKAYKLMKAVKDELISKGELIPDYPAGKVPKHDFDRRCRITH